MILTNKAILIDTFREVWKYNEPQLNLLKRPAVVLQFFNSDKGINL